MGWMNFTSTWTRWPGSCFLSLVAVLVALVKQATDKLDELFTTLFRTERGDSERKDNADGTQPPPKQTS